MRRFIRFKNRKCNELSPVTYSEFDLLDHWMDDNGISWEQWKRFHGYREIEDFSPETLISSDMLIYSGTPAFVLNCFHISLEDTDEFKQRDFELLKELRKTEKIGEMLFSGKLCHGSITRRNLRTLDLRIEELIK
jgi:hypothetical protein